MIKSLSEYKEFKLNENSMCLRYGNDAISDINAFDPLITYKKEYNGIAKFREEIKPYLIYD